MAAWTELATAQLSRWGILPADAERCGMFEVPDARAVYPEFHALPVIVLPYFKPDGSGQIMQFDRGPFCRIRYLKDPPLPRGFSGKQKKPQRYTQPRDSGVHIYFPPVLDWPKLLADTDEPIIITEGEAKAAAACLAGFPCLALGGVSSWGITGTELLHNELQGIPWTKRVVFICFDSDAVLNGSVRGAEAKLVDALQLHSGAQCCIVRIPPDGNGKVGLDDYLKKFGAAGLSKLLLESEALGTLDAKVMSLNKRVAWIKKEGMIWDHESKVFIRKDNFTTGDEYGAMRHTLLAGAQRAAPKVVNVAKAWLNHPHAARFDEIIFKPGELQMVETDDGRPALNMWSGWRQPGTGDVQPFLDLSAFLFNDMADPMLPVKLLAYKAQNPQKKIPLALVLISAQGSGKTLWTEIVQEAFAPYAAVIPSASLSSQFRGWLEKTLIGVIHEAEKLDMIKAGDILKTLISDEHQSMNEKFRQAREVKSYTLYILTANKRAVASFSADDRRMIVVECPPRKQLGDDVAQFKFYHEHVGAWKQRGGARDLLGWLLRYDLQGWTPPIAAPDSHEKFMAYQEGLTPVQKLAAYMKQCQGTSAIIDWLSSAQAWAENAITSNNSKLLRYAQAIGASVGQIPVRPFYEPRELAMIFPQLLETNMGATNWFPENNSPEGQISRALRDESIPFLRPKDDHRGFWWQGQWRQYLVVSDIEDWRQPLSQTEFERIMGMFPSFAAAKFELGKRQ